MSKVLFRTASNALLGAVMLTASFAPLSEAAVFTKKLKLQVDSVYSGQGYFKYDDEDLQPLGDLSGNQFTSIIEVAFAYDGENEQSINDPDAIVNFDSSGNFLGIDLILPAPVGQIDDVLIANDDAYIPSIAFVANEKAVEYSSFEAVDEPQVISALPLLLGLVMCGKTLLRKTEPML